MNSFNKIPLTTSRAQSITLSFILGVGVALAGCASDDELDPFDDADWVTLSDAEATELAETAIVLEQSEVETMVARDDDGGLRTTSSAGYWLENEGEVAFDTTVSCSSTCPGGCLRTGCTPDASRPKCSIASGCANTSGNSNCPASNTCTTTIRKTYK